MFCIENCINSDRIWMRAEALAASQIFFHNPRIPYRTLSLLSHVHILVHYQPAVGRASSYTTTATATSWFLPRVSLRRQVYNEVHNAIVGKVNFIRFSFIYCCEKYPDWRFFMSKLTYIFWHIFNKIKSYPMHLYLCLYTLVYICISIDVDRDRNT